MNNKTRSKGLAIVISIGVALLCSARYTAPTTNILVEGAIPDSKVFGGPVYHGRTRSPFQRTN